MQDNIIKVYPIESYLGNVNIEGLGFYQNPKIHAAEDATIYTTAYGGKPKRVATGLHLDFDITKISVFLINLTDSVLMQNGCMLYYGLQRVEPNRQIAPLLLNVGTNHVQITNGTAIAELVVMPAYRARFKVEGSLIG